MNRFSRILYPFVIARNIFLREIGANQDRYGAERQSGCRFRGRKIILNFYEKLAFRSLAGTPGRKALEKTGLMLCTGLQSGSSG